MQARALLMKEHRLIERMLSYIRQALPEIEESQQVDPRFVEAAVDFIRTYADRTHHGKEEDILFAEVALRGMSDEDRRAMEKLMDEHAFARAATARLAQANERYRHGDAAALADVLGLLRALCDFYPGHIAGEDRSFFAAAKAYFTEDEDQELLRRFREFDRSMIHEKYAHVVADMQSAAAWKP
jgi:hemerythrin-like domain-containing protein